MREVAAPRHPVEVADLFYNLPARRKFLGIDGARRRRFPARRQLALAYPEVGLR